MAKPRADVTIGITVFMQNCSFQAEVSRRTVNEIIAELDADLTRQGVPAADTTQRVSAVMLRSMDASALLTRGEMTEEDGVMEIACGFMYAYVKEHGAKRLNSLHGLIGCLADNTVYLNPCADAQSYTTLVPAIREQAQSMLGIEDDDLINGMGPKPTIHFMN